MSRLPALFAFLVSLAAGCVATPSIASPGPEVQRRPPQVAFKPQVALDSSGARFWRELPVVSLPGDVVTEALVNADLQLELGGAAYVDVPSLPAQEALSIGDALTTCATTFVDEQVIAFRCDAVSMGAHPYYTTHGMAYDLRAGTAKRLKARDLFGDAGAIQLASIVAQRARAQAIAHGDDPGEVAPTIDPFELFPNRVEVVFDRCSLGSCMNPGETVLLTCADLSQFVRSDTPWKCA